MGFNLSKWALENRSLVVYIMIAASIVAVWRPIAATATETD